MRIKTEPQLWFAVVIFLLFSTAMRAQAQTGTYTTYLGGKAIVLDQYQVTSNADGTLRTEAALSAPTGGPQQKAVTVAVNHRPVSFTLSLGDKVLLGAEFKGATVVLRKADQTGTDLQTKATMVLENLLWHQFVFLLDQYDETKGGLQSFVAFLLSQALDYPITVERVGTPAYQAGSQTTKTRRYHVVANKVLELEMWTDDVRAPFLFYNAAQQLKVVRTGFESLTEAVLVDAPKAAAYQPPAYALPSMFREQEVTVGAGTEWTLPATLTLPTGVGPFPAVVLVHGSGPNDRDETIGPNKPFRDLAQGLASQGIAVLRYEKRTRAYPGKVVALQNLTVKEETTDDALAAVALLRKTQQIDQKRVFVLGHSLGGMLIPRIGLADQGIAGFIVFAGATRPLEDEWVRQFEYIYGLRGPLTANQKAEIEGYKQQATRVKQLAPADANSKELLLMVPPSYWLDLRGYFPPDVALKLKAPMLILQGERDYNVTMDAYHDWERRLGQRAGVTFKSYPKLDHLFLEGTGPASDADYARPRNIPKYVVDDIVTWIKKN
jgi:dienelactone hydrolase